MAVQELRIEADHLTNDVSRFSSMHISFEVHKEEAEIATSHKWWINRKFGK